MMQHQFLAQPVSSFYSTMSSVLNHVDMFGFSSEETCFDGFEFTPPFLSDVENSSGLSSSPSFDFASPVSSNDFDHFPVDLPVEGVVMEDFPIDLEYLDPKIFEELDQILDYKGMETSPAELSMDEFSPSPSMKSGDEELLVMDSAPVQASLIFPEADVDNKYNLRILYHVLMAYAEAIQNGEFELADAIQRTVKDKVNPVGESLERIAFMILNHENQIDDLKQEAEKNYEAAFKTFYQSFPYAKFAHFGADSVILDYLPSDAEVIHVVDFDMQTGIQWVTILEALAAKVKEVVLTSIKWGDEDINSPTLQSFEYTKKRLCNHARSIGLKLKVEEVEMESLVSEIKKMNKRGGKRRYLVFNCMVNLPHMSKPRSRKSVTDFLRVAKDLISDPANCKTSNRGIITFADGDVAGELTHCPSFSSFFESHLAHYQALFESVEASFPLNLVEARMAMEILFLSPFVSSHEWTQKWENREDICDLQVMLGLEGCQLSNAHLIEARELVKHGVSLYGASLGGQNQNEMTLEWKGTPLVKVSSWR